MKPNKRKDAEGGELEGVSGRGKEKRTGLGGKRRGNASANREFARAGIRSWMVMRVRDWVMWVMGMGGGWHGSRVEALGFVFLSVREERSGGRGGEEKGVDLALLAHSNLHVPATHRSHTPLLNRTCCCGTRGDRRHASLPCLSLAMVITASITLLSSQPVLVLRPFSQVLSCPAHAGANFFPSSSPLSRRRRSPGQRTVGRLQALIRPVGMGCGGTFID